MSLSQSDWPKRITLSAAVIVGVLGIAALVAWHLHLTALLQVLPTVVPIERMTSLGLLLMGFALFAVVSGHRGVTVICTLVVLLQAILVCLEYVLNISFGIDQLLGRDYINVQTSNLGRMSPVTALCFIASCIAVLAIAKPVLFRYGVAVCGIVASVLIAVSTVNSLGIALGHSGTYGWSQFSRMSLHASIGFAFISVGLLAWAWRETPQKNVAPDWLPWGIGLGLAAAALGLYQALTLTENQEIERSLLYGIIFAGGLVAAFLVAVAAAQAVRSRRQKDVLDRMVQGAPDAVLLIDRRGRIWFRKSADRSYVWL